MNLKKYSKNKKAFTLIELMVVLAIAGTLTAIVITSSAVSKASAHDLKRISDMKEIQIPLAIYYDVNKVYPNHDGTTYNAPLLMSGGYISSWPTDPTPTGKYVYQADAQRKHYCLGVLLESKDPNTIEDHVPGSGCVLPNGMSSNSQVYKVYR
jgi:general secretion pathway protein G